MERVRESGLFIANSTRNQANDGVGHTSRREFTACEHEVTNRNLLRDEVFADAIVNPFIVATKDNEVTTKREFIGHRLVKLLTIGGRENHFIVIALSL